MRTTRRSFLMGTAGAAVSRPRPNIVVLLADDMGFSDLGCYGSEIATPRLDRMAAEGVRFTQFYNTAKCCPSRASILTGLYPHQAGVGDMDSDWGIPSYQGRIRHDRATLPEALALAGYRTIMSGKWHLGTRAGDRPWERGFDRFYGIPQGGGVYFWPTPLARDVVAYNREDGRGPVITRPDERFYSTDAFTDYSVEQIRIASRDRQPFFLYAPYVAPHFPQQAWERDVERYLGRYRSGWEKLREGRFRRQKAMGIIGQSHGLAPCDGLPWTGLSGTQIAALDRQMAVYAAQVDSLDRNVGRILEALRETRQEENTLVIFLSDNGAQPNSPLGDEDNPKAVFGSRESYGKYALGWANLSNTPFRRYKMEQHHGGNASPLIVRWPAEIRDRGKLREQPGHIMDLVPTCLEAAGLGTSRLSSGAGSQALEGISLLPYCRRRLAERARTFCWEHMGNRAVRVGDWKLTAPHAGRWELHHVREDRTELHDLAEKYPERVGRMLAVYREWAERCGVLPWPVKHGPSEGASPKE